MALQHDPKHHHRPVVATAINAKYVASTDGGNCILVRAIGDAPGNAPFRLSLNTLWPTHCPVLALSPTRQNLLAAAVGSRVLVFNVLKKRIRCILAGNGRRVTALSFAERDHHVVVTGGVDGSICVWSLKHSSRPLCQLGGLAGACTHIAVRSSHADLLVSVHGNSLVTWSLTERKILARPRYISANVAYLTWRSKDHILLLTSTGRIAEICLRDQPVPAWHESHDSDAHGSHKPRFGAPTAADEDSWSSSISLGLVSPVQQARTLGSNGIVVLPAQTQALYFYSYSFPDGHSTELWRLQVDSELECFTLRECDGKVEALLLVNGFVQTYAVPASVLDAMNCSNDKPWTTGNDRAKSIKTPAEGRMLPAIHVRTKTSHRLIAKPSMQLPSASPVLDRGIMAIFPSAKVPVFSTPDPAPRQSSLLVEGNRVANPSPMPFLSPTVPARHLDSYLVQLPVDSLSLLPRSSFDSMASTGTHAHDSDSDDETFGGDRENNSSFLPGGVSVPIARTCGATFAPNDNLLTFFPMRQRGKPADGDVEESPKQHHGNGYSHEAIALFPAFGYYPFADMGSTFAPELRRSLNQNPALTLPALKTGDALVESHVSWSERHSPIKTSSAAPTNANRVSVSVRRLEELASGHQIAISHRMTSNCSSDIADVSRVNASAAKLAGYQKEGELWDLLAALTEPMASAGLGDQSESSTFPPSTWAKLQLLSQRIEKITKDPTCADFYSSVIEPSHPLGGLWAIDQIFTSLEKQASTPLMAVMSAVLGGIRPTPTKVTHTTQGAVSSDILTYPATLFETSQPPSELRRVSAEHLAPNLSRHNSERSLSFSTHRNTSHPFTTRLDPATYAPSLVQPGNRTSHSGSASPEHSRNSFSMATKSFAVSIAERFASYGSSPPAIRQDASSENELSTSLPNVPPTGSWAKSVSFASTLGVDGGDQTVDFLREDDEHANGRTVDANGQQTTPRSTTGPLLVLKNESCFKNNTTGGVDASLPDRFRKKSAVWRHHFAEQLRSWDLVQQAAELDLVGNSGTYRKRHEPSSDSLSCEVTGPLNDAVCSICYCVIHRASQFCPICFHTMHPSCLDDFICSLGDALFTCPSGCGCFCGSETNGLGLTT